MNEGIKPGVYYDMPFSDYLAMPALSSSMLRDLGAMTPRKARWKWDHPEPPTDALDFGRAAHQWLLEGDQWLKGWSILPEDHDGRRKEGKDRMAEIAEAGLRPLKWEAHQSIKAMVEEARRHPLVKGLLYQARPEVTLVWEDRATGVLKKARPDALADRPAFPDFKTTATGMDDDSLRRTIEKYRYYQQAAHYEEGIAALGLQASPVMALVFQDKDAPHEIRVITLDDASYRANARDVNRRRTRRYVECLRSGEWPSWPAEITTIEMSPWEERKIAAESDDDYEAARDWQAPLEETAA